MTVTLKSVKFEVQTRYDTHVTDDGRFRTVSDEDETIYNQSSGLYEKNPNDGAAHISLLTASGEAIGGVEQPLDPNFPLPYGQTGVQSVEKTYDGVPAGIQVDVVRPETDNVIKYTTDRSDPNSWTTELPTFSDAGAYTVYYAVEDEHGNYAAVTNFARVVIHPAEVVVTAHDVGKRADQPDPELTASVTGVNVTGDTPAEQTDALGNKYWVHTVTVLNANGDTDTLTYTLERDPGNTVGEYPIHAAGAEYQSGKVPDNANPNCHVTYVPVRSARHAQPPARPVRDAPAACACGRSCQSASVFGRLTP